MVTEEARERVRRLRRHVAWARAVCNDDWNELMPNVNQANVDQAAKDAFLGIDDVDMQELGGEG